jgi:F0F1-type ATP synthase assembly protein I
MATDRRKEINARRTRKKKLKKLRVRLADSKSPSDKEKILSKAARIAPWMSSEDFVATVKK